MPELPDVEGFRRFLADTAAGRRIARVEAPDDDLLRNTTPQGLGRAVTGSAFAAPRRHGKWLLADTDGGSTVVLHFGMTGYLSWSEPDEPRHEHDRVVFVTDGGELRFNCMRKFGGVWLASSDADVESITGPLGPDALEADAEVLRGRLADRRGGIKSALMDQSVIAGLGNLLADEILWRAGIHPRTPVSQVDVDVVAEVTADVLAAAVPTGRVPPHDGWLTGARDEEEPRCPRCGAALTHGRVAGRSTWWCPHDQPTPQA